MTNSEESLKIDFKNLTSPSKFAFFALTVVTTSFVIGGNFVINLGYILGTFIAFLIVYFAFRIILVYPKKPKNSVKVKRTKKYIISQRLEKRFGFNDKEKRITAKRCDNKGKIIKLNIDGDVFLIGDIWNSIIQELYTFYTFTNKKKAIVYARETTKGVRYLTTHPDGVTPNNLNELRNF